jgi:hypothetical protein
LTFDVDFDGDGDGDVANFVPPEEAEVPQTLGMFSGCLL